MSLHAIGVQVLAGPAPAAASAGTEPTITAEIAFDGTNYVAVPPSDLAAWEVVRGRQRELDRFQAGRATVTLRNDTRRYDPNHTPGAPYEGNVKPMRKLRLVATYAGVSYSLFTGFIDRVEQQYGGPHDAVAVFQATDAFKVLARKTLPSSAYYVEVSNDAPRAWWRLGEPAGSTQVFDSAGTSHGTVTGTPVFGADGLIDREDDGAVQINNRTSWFTMPATALPAAGADVTVEFWAERATTQYVDVFEHLNWPGTPSRLSIQMTGAGDGLYVSLGDNVSVPVASVDGATNLAAGTRYHVVVVLKVGQPITIYVNGADDSTLQTGTVGAGGVAQAVFTIGLQVGSSADPDVVIDEVAVYDYALTAAQVAAHNAAGRTPWTGDLPGERVERVLSSIRSTLPTELHEGSATLQGATLGMSALEHIQKVAESEFGVVYVRGDGTLVLEPRLNLINQPSYGTFTDRHGTNPSIAAVAPDYGDDLLRNRAVVSRLDGVAQTVSDEASIDEFDEATYTLEGLYHDSDALSFHAAEFIVSEYAQPLQRITTLTLRPRALTDLWPQVLGRELTDQVTVGYTPQGVGAEFSQVSQIEGVTHRGGPKEWETTWTLSPAYAGCFLQLDTGDCGLDEGRIYF